MGKARWLAIFGLVVIGGYTIIGIVTRSGNPGMYYRYRHSSDGFVYPTDAVVEACAMVAAEVIVATLILWRTRHFATMCVILAVSGAIVMFAKAPFLMHAPPYAGGDIVLLFFGGCWLVLVSIVSAIGRWYGRRDGAS